MGARFHDRGERDLFEQFQTADKKIRKKTRILLPRLKNTITLSYENIIFLAIGFVIFCIIFFSLGVEKGRQDVGHIRTETSPPRPGDLKAGRENQRPKGVPSEVEGKPARPGQETSRRAGETRVRQAEKQIQNKYIIQLSAFKKKGSAERALAELKREGYHADIKKSGDYFQVYISGFDKKRNAQKLLEELRRKHKDCYIKKLSEEE